MFKHILVPTDGSQLSQDTARRAISFAQETGARITAFYAKPEYPVTYYGEGAPVSYTHLDVYKRQTLIFMPLIIVYTSWAYRVMRGKVTAAYVRENEHGAYLSLIHISLRGRHLWRSAGHRRLDGLLP